MLLQVQMCLYTSLLYTPITSCEAESLLQGLPSLMCRISIPVACINLVRKIGNFLTWMTRLVPNYGNEGNVLVLQGDL